MNVARVLRGYFAESLYELWDRPERQVPALDGVRAAAVVLVILSHFYVIMWEGHVNYPVPAMAGNPVFYYGWTGVDLFFILSGYLIGMQLWREKKKTGTIGVWQFILRRWLRIWPLYFTIMLLGLVTGAFQPVLADWMFFSNYADAGLARGWTLSTEEQFYILIPLLLLFTPGIKRLEWYFLILGGIVISVWISRYYTCTELLQPVGRSCKEPMVGPFHLHNEGLIAGLAIALFAVIRPDYFKRSSANRFSWLGFSILVAAWGAAALLYWVSDVVFNFTSLALVFGSTTLWLLWDRSVFSRPACWRIWYPVSRLSYGMYLNHFVFFPGITAWVVAEMVELSGSTAIASYVGIIVAIAISMLTALATFLLVERPFLLLRARWLAAKKEPKVVEYDPKVLARY